MKKLLIAVSLVATLTSCGGDSADDAKGGAGGPGGRGARSASFPVELLTVESRPVEYVVSAVGSVEAFERVEVTARVAGVVERVRFSEGAAVRPGSVLAEIEPERYRLAVAAAQATMQKQIASKAEAEAGLARREAASAKNPGLIRGEEIETWRTRVSTASAEVEQARAAVEQVKLNLRDALVTAPVGGVIQTRTVQTGQYVQPGTVLATLVRRDPLLLRFQVAEQDSQRLRPGMTVRFLVAGESFTHTARITYVSEAANMASRMVPVTAHVTDPNRDQLKAGAFARVTVPVGAAITAPVIPQTAIRPSERGFVAFVVEGDTAHERLLALGMRTPTGEVEIRNGLKAGEKLVIRGAEALRDGAKVKVAPQPKGAA